MAKIQNLLQRLQKYLLRQNRRNENFEKKTLRNCKNVTLPRIFMNEISKVVYLSRSLKSYCWFFNILQIALSTMVRIFYVYFLSKNKENAFFWKMWKFCFESVLSNIWHYKSKSYPFLDVSSACHFFRHFLGARQIKSCFKFNSAYLIWESSRIK